MQINANLISYLEELSNFTLSDSEKTQLTEDLKKILIDITRIKELNTEGLSENVSPWDASFDKANIFRNDEAFTSFDRESILKNAPIRNEEFFIAPKTVE